MYGRFKSKPTEEDEKAVKLARLSKMKKIYLPPRISPSKLCSCLTCLFCSNTDSFTNLIHG